jgi:curved DNA-binding protein CbpA
MSLYEILGVEPDATSEQIHAAYRAAAKTTHPDMPGGDRKAFDAVAQAYAVLGNGELRAFYDQTGETSPARARKIEDMAHQIIDQYIAGLADAPAHAFSVDLVSQMVDMCSQAISNMNAAIAQLKRQAANLEKFKKKISKADDGRPDFMTASADNKIRAIQSSIEQTEIALQAGQRAMSLIEAYKFDPDPPAAYATGIHTLGTITSTGGWR